MIVVIVQHSQVLIDLLSIHNQLSLFYFPGLFGSCSVIDGVRQSTFECFYNESCLHKLNNILQVNFDQLYMNESAYLPNQTLDNILSQQFEKSLYITSDYPIYFKLCAPSICQYSFIQRNDALYVFTVLLGVYGGLTAALKLIVWYSLYVYRTVFRRCRSPIEPIENDPSL